MIRLAPRLLWAFALTPLVAPAIMALILPMAGCLTFAVLVTYAAELSIGLPLYALIGRQLRRPWVSVLVGGATGFLGIVALFVALSAGDGLRNLDGGVGFGVFFGLPLGCVSGGVFWLIAFIGAPPAQKSHAQL